MRACVLGSSAPSVPRARSSSLRRSAPRSEVSIPSRVGRRSGKSRYGSVTLPVARSSWLSAASAAWRRATLAGSRSASTIGGSMRGAKARTAWSPAAARWPSARSTAAETEAERSATHGSMVAKIEAAYGWRRWQRSNMAPSSRAASSRWSEQCSMSVMSCKSRVRSIGRP